MGWEEINDPRGGLATKSLSAYNFKAGYWPFTYLEGIPGNILDPASVHGFAYSSGAIYYNDRLQPYFGNTTINTTGSGSITSMKYMPIFSRAVGSRGNKLYDDYATAAPTDITGSLTITPGAPVEWTEWKFDTTTQVIGTNGINEPWKFTGSGSANLLLGTPPKGQWITTWQNSLWMASAITPLSELSKIRFSALGDPESWDPDDNYVFDARINGIKTFGDQLVVFMDDHIGILSGGNNRALNKIDRWVEGIGCNNQRSIAQAKFRGKDVLIFLSTDGVYLYDGTQGAIKISSQLNPLFNDATRSLLVSGKFTQAVGQYLPQWGWYIVSLPYNTVPAQTANNARFIFDLNNLVEQNGQLYAPCWPDIDISVTEIWESIINIPAKSIQSQIFFSDINVGIKSFAPGVLPQRNLSVQSKVYDLGETFLIQDVDVLHDNVTGSPTFQLFFSGKVDQLGTYEPVDMASGSGTSVFSDDNAPVQTGVVGQYLSFSLKNTTPTFFNLDKINLTLTPLGNDPTFSPVTIP
jgi:hypothetical protein